MSEDVFLDDFNSIPNKTGSERVFLDDFTEKGAPAAETLRDLPLEAEEFEELAA